ncbi:MAG: hypothetical protein ACI8W3_003370 [Myxococcota bacterium]|jgi:hypothetical protein
MTKTYLSLCAAVVLLWAMTGVASATISTTKNPTNTTSWTDYLNHAYVYSSARPEDLRIRLGAYGRSVGVTLSDYIVERYGDESLELGEDEQRRKAIAYLLDYLADGEAESIRAAVSAIEELDGVLERHENRYWYHYIRAHQALHFGDVALFSDEIFDLWVQVVAELESPFKTVQTLSLDASATSGFVTTLPYLYENIARIILIRSQTLGIDQSLDSLASIVFMLEDGRVGTVPEIIARENSSIEYLEHIVARLRGAESDGGGLTFTLALVEAEKAHHAASSSLASEGFSQTTVEATRVAMGAYRKALRHAVTLQGQSAVYVRVLREMGEIYATSQRLEVELTVELPFGIAEAAQVYGALHKDRRTGWERHGFQDVGQEAYFDAMHELWQEIQEVSLNAAEYELTRASAPGEQTDGEHINAALGRYGDFLALFNEFATPEGAEAVPDSAYVGAHLAHRGMGAAALRFNGGNPTREQIGLAVAQFTKAIDLYPFDRQLWSSLAATLERTGREAEFLSIVKPTALKVSRSTYVDRWVRGHETRALEIGAYRNALGNDLAIMYFGFADDRSLTDLQRDIASLQTSRGELDLEIAVLGEQRETLVARRSEILRSDEFVADGLPAVSGAPPGDETGRISQIDISIRSLATDRDRLDNQLIGRAKALSLYEDALSSDGFLEEIAAQREQPVHALVRRFFYEDESESRFGDREFVRSVPSANHEPASKRAARPAYDRMQP